MSSFSIEAISRTKSRTSHSSYSLGNIRTAGVSGRGFLSTLCSCSVPCSSVSDSAWRFVWVCDTDFPRVSGGCVAAGSRGLAGAESVDDADSSVLSGLSGLSCIFNSPILCVGVCVDVAGGLVARGLVWVDAFMLLFFLVGGSSLLDRLGG